MGTYLSVSLSFNCSLDLGSFLVMAVKRRLLHISEPGGFGMWSEWYVVMFSMCVVLERGTPPAAGIVRN